MKFRIFVFVTIFTVYSNNVLAELFTPDGLRRNLLIYSSNLEQANKALARGHRDQAISFVNQARPALMKLAPGALEILFSGPVEEFFYRKKFFENIGMPDIALKSGRYRFTSENFRKSHQLKVDELENLRKQAEAIKKEDITTLPAVKKLLAEYNKLKNFDLTANLRKRVIDDLNNVKVKALADRKEYKESQEAVNKMTTYEKLQLIEAPYIFDRIKEERDKAEASLGGKDKRLDDVVNAVIKEINDAALTPVQRDIIDKAALWQLLIRRFPDIDIIGRWE